MDQITIGDRIRELRISKNPTQDDLVVLINSNAAIAFQLQEAMGITLEKQTQF